MICVVRTPAAFTGDCTKSERLMISSFREPEVFGYAAKFLISKQQVRRIEQRSGSQPALQQKSRQIHLLLTREAPAPALEPFERGAADSDDRFRRRPRGRT
jgi:hypothetical protein